DEEKALSCPIRIRQKPLGFPYRSLRRMEVIQPREFRQVPGHHSPDCFRQPRQLSVFMSWYMEGYRTSTCKFLQQICHRPPRLTAHCQNPFIRLSDGSVDGFIITRHAPAEAEGP